MNQSQRPAGKPNPPRQSGGGTQRHAHVPPTPQINLPLHREARSMAGQIPDDAHLGLVWERFFDRYQADFSEVAASGEGGPAFIKQIADRSRHPAQQQTDRLTTAIERQRRLVEALGGRSLVAMNDWHFATGLGIDHPTENGFLFHRTLGTPYLPGSSIKGLVRGYIEWLNAVPRRLPAKADLAAQLKRWFGSEHKNEKVHKNQTEAGWFIFFDALPVRPVALKADVMTPHYGGWYQEGGSDKAGTPENVPADWHSPVPVAFLVADKPEFFFSVAVRSGLPAEDRATAQVALEEVMALLQEALDHFGAGAKTAVGYGRFDPVTTD